MVEVEFGKFNNDEKKAYSFIVLFAFVVFIVILGTKFAG